MHMVKKTDGGWQSFGDNCCLNTAIIPDLYPLPNFSDFTSKVSKLDLHKGYYQVPMCQDDIQKMTIITLFVVFNSSASPLDSGTRGILFKG